jgi:nitroimidazol reductase NimA-like FMN-containing flavoprotein (pyridoxamine 5'-phosphate oxidase superfamily)
MRRKDKEITDMSEIEAVLEKAKYVTLAMCRESEPYLVTLSHGYDRKKDCLYFHCAGEGKKIDILQENNRVWGQALEDRGYVPGKCDHLFATVHFEGRVSFIRDSDEKKHALTVMIQALEDNPYEVIKEQLTTASLARVTVGRIDILSKSGKKADKVIVST